MSPYEIISKKRDGKPLQTEEIQFFIGAYVRGEIPDYQMSSLLMAIYLKGMTQEETQALMESYLYSGKTVDLSHIPGVKVDKHSTGGVGDKVSILLAPIVASAGVPVPMISGRGLGHTGGTLDKLESIPGFRIDYSIENYVAKIARTGVCLIGQTPELAPADKKIYALRDVTATIESYPLIAASIMSKKLAEGIDALVLDVKTGRGAFMQDYERSVELAKLLIQIGENAGKPTVAYITDMNNPLGRNIGNWLEIRECLDCFHGGGDSGLLEVTLHLCGAMIYLGKKADSPEEGYFLSQEKLKSGAAWNKFLQIIEEQEGDTDAVKHPEKYPESSISQDVNAVSGGWIASIDALETGLCAILLGAGRQKVDDQIDPYAGIILHKKTGEKVEKGDKLFTIFTEQKNLVDAICDRLLKAYSFSDTPVSNPQMIREFMDITTI